MESTVLPRFHLDCMSTKYNFEFLIILDASLILVVSMCLGL
uniref:Transmembrane protein n=1 Tax=Arundo donax TaxID=35708 RepID=A0A0A9HF51_ARUDO